MVTGGKSVNGIVVTQGDYSGDIWLSINGEVSSSKQNILAGGHLSGSASLRISEPAMIRWCTLSGVGQGLPFLVMSIWSFHRQV